MSRINTRFSTYIKPGLLSELPIDLKREILEIAAYIHRPFATRMAILSREVNSWVERTFYRELFFNGEQPLHRSDGSDHLTVLERFKVTLESRPPAFFAEHVHSLHFDGNISLDDILPILRVCTGVTNLGMYATIERVTSTEVFRLIHQLPLHTLFISSKNLASLLRVSLNPGASGHIEKAETADDEAQTSEQYDEDASEAENSENLEAAASATVPTSELSDTQLPSCLLTLERLALVDGYVYPSSRFPSLTHLAIAPDYEDKVVPYVKIALANQRIESVVAMLSYVNTPRQIDTIRALRDITNDKFVLFTLPVAARRYIEDDLWDLANEFPDEEQPITYLTEIPGPRILSFQELMELEAKEKETTVKRK